MSNQEVRDQVLIFLLAGHETTSTALTFTMHLLGRHPDVQAAVHREIADVLGGRAPQAHDIARLKLTEMTVKEALRLYPPAYALGRLAEHDVTIAGQPIPAKSIVLLSPWTLTDEPIFRPSRSGSTPDGSTGCRAGTPSIRLFPVCEWSPRLHPWPLRHDGSGCRGRHAAGTVLGGFRVARDPLADQHHTATSRSGVVPTRSAGARSALTVTTIVVADRVRRRSAPSQRSRPVLKHLCRNSRWCRQTTHAQPHARSTARGPPQR